MACVKMQTVENYNAPCRADIKKLFKVVIKESKSTENNLQFCILLVKSKAGKSPIFPIAHAPT